MEQRIRTKFIQYDSIGNLYCYKCGIYKPETEFDTNRNKSNWFRNYKDKRCKECKKLQMLKRKQNNRGKQDLDRLLLERWHGVMDRSKRKGWECDITIEFLRELWCKQNGLCAISKIPMTYIFNSGRVPTNLSVDRIDSNKIYTKNNVQLVCMAVNQMKSDLNDLTFYKFCEAIVANAAKWNKSKKKK
ncbi:hypothetical protein [uncultured phage cr1_1]|uniref:Uncharacterized protein n=1 Tax=uncultured phage cr1_1 TaxID=2772064 RepID=A0A7M1RVM3_9CAUD|nr:endonuclease [uncultured phage cr1_1]QOR58465.1 hypothetical protein [uncultured phage cr1_1]